MKPPTPRPLFNSKPVSPGTARRYNLDVRPLLSPKEVAGVVQVEDLWLESPVPADEAWIVAHRIVVQDHRAVVAEVRVFPREDTPDREPGSWSGEWRGRLSSVPAGGLTTRALRSVRLGHDVHTLQTFIEHVRQRPALRWLLDPDRGWFGAVGVTEALTTERKPPAPRPGPGRPRLSAQDLAQLAAAYVRAIEHGSRTPIQDVAAQFKLPESRTRSRIHKARTHGLLDTGRRGSAGGQLTPAAKKLLKKGTRDVAKRTR